jgi:hypothetical protein
MRKLLGTLLLAASLLAAAPDKPKLVLAIVIDQFRYDYLTRFRDEYHAGFDRLLTHGAVFTNAFYDHFPTVTAIGHSTFLSGATPALSGIIGNAWYDRDEGGQVTAVSDPAVHLLGGLSRAGGSSPRRLLASTVGDELKIANGGKSRVIGISLKDRAAILPVGHMADAAYWFDTASGNFVSSDYYFADVPEWVKEYNAARPGDRFVGATWLDRKIPTGKQLYTALDASPFGNELVESFAERALDAEQLGKREFTDVLAVSFSSNDYVGHELGPDSREVHEMALRTDTVLEKLFQAVGKQVGLEHVVVILTADHGVAPVPELNIQRHMPGGRLSPATITKTAETALKERYGDFPWILSTQEASLYLNQVLIAQHKLDPEEVNRTAAAALAALPHVFRVFTRQQLLEGLAPHDLVGRRVMNGYYMRRGADVEVLLEPYFILTATGATHGTVFSYDSHVPVIFMGPGIRPGRYNEDIVVNDIAPTLSTLLDVETPSGSVGRCLTEILER